MNDKQVTILAGVCALAALYLFMRTNQVKAQVKVGNPGAREVTPPNSNGWRYFSDGTAIDPMGNYYFKGELVYTAPAAGSLDPMMGPPDL